MDKQPDGAISIILDQNDARRLLEIFMTWRRREDETRRALSEPPPTREWKAQHDRIYAALFKAARF